MSAGRVLIYGGKGALGAVCVDVFKSKGWWTCSIDLVGNDQADANVIVQPSNDLCTQATQVSDAVAAVLASNKVNAVLCVAGGWAGGNAASKDFMHNTDLVLKQSVWTSVIAGQLAAAHLVDGGMLQLTGAKAALGATPGMVGYGLAKAAVHQMTKSFASDGGGLPKSACVLAILPVTLDTPMNRKFMPKADFGTWTPLEFVAGKLLEWTGDESTRPKTGSLVQLITRDGKTELTCVEH